VIFGHTNDFAEDGVMYLDNLRVYTLDEEVVPAPAGPPAAVTTSLRAAPNPFNPSTDIRFELDRAARVQLEIFDSRGHRVRRLMQDTLPAGSHGRTWNGFDDAGRRVASGVYHARLMVDGSPQRLSLTMVK
jgi:hypothetical protein